MKQVIQLDAADYFVGFTTADESPLEPGVFLMPAGTIDAPAPEIPEGKRAKWTGSDWSLEDIPPEKPDQPYPSWVYNEETNEWDAPEPKPDEGAEWDEENQLWVPGAEVKARNIRAERDRLLADSDWTQLPDAPVDQAAWATYRQALRDVPEQAGFPDDINWPKKP